MGQSHQVEDHDDVDGNEEEMHMVEPAYRDVDPPEQDDNSVP